MASDRERLEKLRRLRDLRARAAGRGEVSMPEPAAQPETEPEPERTGGVEAGLRGLSQGVTLGWGEELLGAPGRMLGRALGKWASGDESIPDYTYEEALGRERESLAQAREDQPGMYLTGELAGGFALPGGAAKTVAGKSARMLPKVLRGSAVGAAYGGAAGAGYADEGDRLEGAKRGALLGGAVGAAVPMVGRGLQRARQELRPENQTARRIRDVVRDPEEAQRLLDKNPELWIGDLTSETRDMLSRQAARDPQVMNKVLQRAEKAGEKAAKQARQATQRLTPPPTPSGKAIERTFSNLPQPKTNFKSIVTKYSGDDEFVKALRKAEKTVTRGGMSNTNKRRPMAVLDATQSILRKRAGKKGLRSREGGGIEQLRQSVIDDIEAVNPGYRDTITQYGVRSQQQRDYAKALKAFEKVEDRVMNRIEGPSLAKYVDDLPSTPKYQKELQELFGGDQQTIDAFSEGLRMHKAALDAAAQAKKVGSSQGVINTLQTGADEIYDAVKGLFRASAADRALGVQQKLGTATALRKLLYSISENLPAVNVARPGSRDAEQMVNRYLTGRRLPGAPDITAEALRAGESTAAGGLGVGLGAQAGRRED